MRAGLGCLVVVIMVAAGCNAAAQREQPPVVQSPRNLESEISALKLSEMCATAAEAFWQRGKYDHPDPPATNTTENWGHQSHYNTEQKRCFILVELVTVSPGGRLHRTREVFDAIEGGYPLASFFVLIDGTQDLLKAGTKIPTTPENLAWFQGLMSK
jgi:hypothetical protein